MDAVAAKFFFLAKTIILASREHFKILSMS